MNNKSQYTNRAIAQGFESITIGRQSTHKYNRSTKKLDGFNQLPAVNRLGEDGKDHINTHHRATTDLGNALSPYGDYPFMHPEYGQFRTVHGILAWLRNPAQPDNIRTMSGHDVEKVRIHPADEVELVDYSFIYMDCTWLKIQTYPELAKAFKESTLPFDLYYFSITDPENNKSIRVRGPTAVWVIRGLNELRNALKEDREPNLDFLLPRVYVELAENRLNPKGNDASLEVTYNGTGSGKVKRPLRPLSKVTNLKVALSRAPLAYRNLSALQKDDTDKQVPNSNSPRPKSAIKTPVQPIELTEEEKEARRLHKKEKVKRYKERKRLARLGAGVTGEVKVTNTDGIVEVSISEQIDSPEDTKEHETITTTEENPQG